MNPRINLENPIQPRANNMDSICEELWQNINAIGFKKLISALPKEAGIDGRLFKKTKLAKNFTLDTTRWLDGSWMNPNAMFELFGTFSDETSEEVRSKMLDILGASSENGFHVEFYDQCFIALHMAGIELLDWMSEMRKPDTPGDEIMLFELCKNYNRHCMVYTRGNIWSTVSTETPIPEEQLSELCPIKLLYIEPGVYGELTP